MYNDSLILYLNGLDTTNNYSLVNTKPKQLKSIEQIVDLKDRTTLKETGEEIMAFPSLLLDSIKKYPEQLRFETKTFENPFVLSGSFIANIIAKINKKDFDIIIDLYEQLPNGKYLALSRNIQRASYAKDKTVKTLLYPNKIETIKLENTFITCKKIEKGSKLIAVIGVNKNQNWEINYGSGKEVSQEDMKDAKIPMKISWYNNSFLNLKILK
jgi:predicted acyl esterase